MVNLEEKILIASDINSAEARQHYSEKLSSLVDQFRKYQESWSVKVKRKLTSFEGQALEAKELFDFLYSEKSQRYNNSPELSVAIENQMSPDRNQRVGNCTGLTSLYSVSGMRIGLNLSIGLVQHGENGELHVRNVLQDGDREIQIENTSKRGFDYRGSVNYDELVSAELLVPITYNHRARAQLEAGNLSEAAQLFGKAIEEYPDFDVSYYNLGSLLLQPSQPMLDRAIPLFNKAISLRPSEDAYFGLASAYGMNGQIQEALNAFGEVLKINPHHLNTYVNMGAILQQVGAKDEALRCFTNARHLDKKRMYAPIISAGIEACN